MHHQDGKADAEKQQTSVAIYKEREKHDGPGHSLQGHYRQTVLRCVWLHILCTHHTSNVYITHVLCVGLSTGSPPISHISMKSYFQ